MDTNNAMMILRDAVIAAYVKELRKMREMNLISESQADFLDRAHITISTPIHATKFRGEQCS